MASEVFIYKMSEHMESAQILAWLVREGERVEEGQPLLEVMTDKVSAELASPASGILKGIRPGTIAGAQVAVGEIVAFIADPGEEVPMLPPLGGLDTPHQMAGPEAAPAEVEPGIVRSTPIARRIARELNVDIARITGTGPNGRVTEQDVQAYAKGRAAALSPVELRPVPTDPKRRADGDVWLELTPVQRVTGERMRDSLLTAPQFALSLDVDMTNALWLREALMDRVAAETGERLSVTGVLVKVVASTLPSHPRANASFVDGRLRLRSEIHIGVALGTESGLAVPVLRNADRKSLSEITRDLVDFQRKGETFAFAADDLADGTFTISNLGMHGIDRFQAILNPPQSAILAVGRVVKRPIGLPDGSIALRPMMNLTLTADHRCMDGLQAAHFLSELGQRLERPYFLI